MNKKHLKLSRPDISFTDLSLSRYGNPPSGLGAYDMLLWCTNSSGFRQHFGQVDRLETRKREMRYLWREVIVFWKCQALAVKSSELVLYLQSFSAVRASWVSFAFRSTSLMPTVNKRCMMDVSSLRSLRISWVHINKLCEWICESRVELLIVCLTLSCSYAVVLWALLLCYS